MDIWSFASILLLLLLSAFFSGSEIAYASVSKVRLKKAAESGNKAAGIALYIAEHFDDALSTILIGNNLVNIAASSVATVILVGFMGSAGAAVSTLVMTFFILILGEITPKMIAKRQCYHMALLSSWPLRILMFFLKPVIFVVVRIAGLATGHLSSEQTEPSVTEEELVTLIENVTDNGVIDESRGDLLQSALEFSQTAVQEILTPRTDLVAIDVSQSMEEITEIVLSSSYSRLPVYDETIDNIIGVMHVEHFLKKLVDSEQVDIRSILFDACFLHKTMKLPDAFREMQKNRLEMAVVTDEFGGTMGIVTMEDIMEELVGDIWDESDEITNEYTCVCDNTYEVSGDMSIYDLLDDLEIDDRDFDSEYTTVGGWVIEMLDGFPNVNDTFEYKNISVTVTEMDGRRVEKITVKVTLPETAEE